MVVAGELRRWWGLRGLATLSCTTLGIVEIVREKYVGAALLFGLCVASLLVHHAWVMAVLAAAPFWALSAYLSVTYSSEDLHFGWAFVATALLAAGVAAAMATYRAVVDERSASG